MVRTINEENCMDCGKVTNYYDPNMGRLCPQCTTTRCASFGGNLSHDSVYWQPKQFRMDYLADSNKHLLTDPLVDHFEDIETSATAYHTSNAFWEIWLEKNRALFKQKYLTQKEKQNLLLDIRKLMFDTALECANFFAIKNYNHKLSNLPHQGASKDCTRYAKCLVLPNFNPKKCCSDCYSNSYSVWY